MISEAIQEALERAEWIELELELAQQELLVIDVMIGKYHDLMRRTQSPIHIRAHKLVCHKRLQLVINIEQAENDIRHYRLVAKLLREEHNV